MRLLLSTRVTASDPARVLAAFDEQLFRALAPPFPRLRVVRFDGSRPGDLVAVELDWLLVRQTWTSLITEAAASPDEAYFVDEGQQLPWPFRAWRHRHIARALPTGGVEIRDDIVYSTGFRLFDAILYPVMWLQFAYRKPIYRRVFQR